MELDIKDHRIVTLLTRYGRPTNRALAKAVELSPSACLERVKKLEAPGVIIGYQAIVAPKAVKECFEGWALVRFTDPAAAITTQFVGLIRETPAIIEAHRIAGPYDYALRFLAGDRATWRDFQSRIEALDCRVHTRFGIVLEALK